MKITRIRSHVLRAPIVDTFYYAQGYYPARDAVLVEVETDQGLSGWGQAFGPPETTPALIERHYAPLLLGQDPRGWGAHWHTLSHLTQRLPGGHHGIVSGLEIALLDVTGKALGVPVHRLLGGALRARVKVYATGLYKLERWTTLDAWRDGLIEEALGYRREGFSLCKLKIGFVPRTDVQFVHALREALGPEMGLAVDANCAWDAATAIQAGKAMESANLAWYEEPLPSTDLEGYREVRRAVAIPVSGGESLAGLHAFRDMVQGPPGGQGRAVDVIQPDIIICGGFTAMRQVQALADASHVRLLPHCWGSAISFAASLHYLATVPDGAPSITPTEPLLEYDRSENPLRDALLVTNLRQNGGYLPVPQGPGLGIEIDPGALEKYRVE